MTLNKQATEAGAKAEELHKALYSDTPANESEDDLDTTKLAQDANLEDDDTPIDTPVEPVVVDYETKFKTLQGKYNTEVPTLHRDVRDLTDVVTTLRQQLADAQTAPVDTSVPDTTSIDPSVFEDYGDEFTQLAKTVSFLEDQLSTVQAENTSLKEQVTNVESTNVDVATQNFYGALDREMPEWSTVNTNPDFISWLQEVDTVSGFTRQAHLDSAAETLNSTQALNIFRAFSASKPTPQAYNDNIARQTQPDSVHEGHSPQPEKRYYTRAEIKQFYKEVANGKWDPADVKAIEADLFMAPQEGRVIG